MVKTLIWVAAGKFTRQSNHAFKCDIGAWTNKVIESSTHRMLLSLSLVH